jgi:hypothetical protein
VIGDVRSDLNLGAGLGGLVVHLDDAFLDLAVVREDAGVLARVPQGLVKVVPIPSAAIGRIEIELDLEWTRKRLADPPREECVHLLAILTTFAAEERAVAHMPVIPVDARRERQHKPKHGYRLCRTVREGHSDVPSRQAHARFHGGVVEVAAAFAGAGEDAGVAATASRFL